VKGRMFCPLKSAVFHFVQLFLHRNAALRYPCALKAAAGHSPETELRER
jgi:hypothetical protein